MFGGGVSGEGGPKAIGAVQHHAVVPGNASPFQRCQLGKETPPAKPRGVRAGEQAKTGSPAERSATLKNALRLRWSGFFARCSCCCCSTRAFFARAPAPTAPTGPRKASPAGNAVSVTGLWSTSRIVPQLPTPFVSVLRVIPVGKIVRRASCRNCPEKTFNDRHTGVWVVRFRKPGRRREMWFAGLERENQLILITSAVIITILFATSMVLTCLFLRSWIQKKFVKPFHGQLAQEVDECIYRYPEEEEGGSCEAPASLKGGLLEKYYSQNV
ncbi:hypothetical protein E2320_006322 [Naja naja]|nr:hypothetical protein E2320_006322 [Naja naja]